MTNLQPHRSDYRYRTGDTGHVIEVEVDYRKDARQRGIYISIRPIELKDGCMSFVLMSGYTIFLAPLQRASPKVLAQWAEIMDPIVPALAEAFHIPVEEGKFARGDKDSFRRMVAERLAAVKV